MNETQAKPQPTDAELEAQIARDLEKCDIGMVLTSGKVRAKYARHRKACFKALHDLNVRQGLIVPDQTDAELLAGLLAD